MMHEDQHGYDEVMRYSSTQKGSDEWIVHMKMKMEIMKICEKQKIMNQHNHENDENSE